MRFLWRIPMAKLPKQKHGSSKIDGKKASKYKETTLENELFKYYLNTNRSALSDITRERSSSVLYLIKHGRVF
jgi:hypothetical protein